MAQPEVLIVGGGVIGASIAYHLAELCGFLVRHRDRLWTAPVATVAQHVIEWRKEKA